MVSVVGMSGRTVYKSASVSSDGIIVRDFAAGMYVVNAVDACGCLYTKGGERQVKLLVIFVYEFPS